MKGSEGRLVLDLLGDVVSVLPEESPCLLGGLQVLRLLRFGQVVEEGLDRVRASLGVVDRGFHGILR